MKIVMFALLLSAHCELTTALNKKHFFFSNYTTWIEAQTYCRNYYIDLSSFESKDEIRVLNTSINFGWVGLTKISTKDWQWSDGSPVNFQNWESGQPIDPGHSFCAGVYKDKFYAWHCADTNEWPYFCYKWDTELIVVKENKSWEDALQYCRTHHTDLASLPTDLHFFQAKQTTAETPSVWTGLRFLAGSWFWLIDEDLGYLSGQLPACPANHTYCGSLNLKTQRWENRNCMEKLNFVCY